MQRERGRPPQRGKRVRAFGTLALLPAATACLCAVLPLAVAFAIRGESIGDDLPFHLGSWQDAAQQLRHGMYPRWDFQAAEGLGEPRFVFYPPLSWLLGAALRLLTTSAHAAACFVLIAVAGCWLGMYAATSRIASRSAALVGASVYAAAPYTLFDALQRSAFGELLAAAWLPLLFAAAVQPAPTIAGIAVPLALLWLTNLPAAIAGSYMLLLIALCRILWSNARGTARVGRQPDLRRYLSAVLLGAALGIAMAAFFLLPALHQSGWVQLRAAFENGQSFRDNFLLRHTALTARQALYAISLIAVESFSAFLLVLVAGCLLLRGETRHRNDRTDFPLFSACLLTAVIFLLLLPLSAPVWHYAPELAVLQFPWRLLGPLSLIVAMVATLLVFLLRVSPWRCVAGSSLLALVLGVSGAAQYWRGPQEVDLKGFTRAAVATAVERRPTPEYTPVGTPADDPTASDPVACTARPSIETPWEALHLVLSLQQSQACTVQLRNYPLWRVELNGKPATLLPNANGLIAADVPAGVSHLDITWQPDPLQWIGDLVTLVAAILTVWAATLNGVKTDV